ncbi:winged helix-turn-helix domain-containing protein [Natronorarus salvus]|uniref:winged helix-turn-helix domain-containing protein n=1 Tax=Natronorarus salvus TaxID=3117733 RepID=UPI002F264715
MSDSPLTDRVALKELTNGSTLVFYIIKWYGPITPSEIAERAGMSRETVYSRANELKRQNLITSRHGHTSDAREVVYDIVS